MHPEVVIRRGLTLMKYPGDSLRVTRRPRLSMPDKRTYQGPTDNRRREHRRSGLSTAESAGGRRSVRIFTLVLVNEPPVVVDERSVQIARCTDAGVDPVGDIDVPLFVAVV